MEITATSFDTVSKSLSQPKEHKGGEAFIEIIYKVGLVTQRQSLQWDYIQKSLFPQEGGNYGGY